MGISGLLPLLKEITVQKHVKEWKGKTLAVDAYIWLHRGAFGCAQELATGIPTTKYVDYAMHRVRMLKHYGVTPFIVFDGGLLPSKMGTEGDREKRRNEALAKGNALLAEGKTNQARDFFVKAVDVTPAMAYQLIKALRQEGIQYVVAPYEADPQLAYLEKKGLVDGIITEDSDLLVFGCKNVLFKLDGGGNCSAIFRQDFSKCREYNFSDWSDAEFRQMAILSGCDYLKSIQGLGLKTAYRLVRKYKTAEKVIEYVTLEGQLAVPSNYVDEFRRAELTFLHQRVFDPVERELVHFSPLPEGKTAADMPFVGAELDREYACGLADGNIDPLSKQPVVDLMPNFCAPITTHRTTYKPTPSTSNSARPSSFISSKHPVQPAKGVASTLNFVSRAPASSSPSTSAINPVKNAANQKIVHLVGKGKEIQMEEKVESPNRKRKLFGKKVVIKETKKLEVKVSVKGKEKMIEVEEEEDVMIIEEEEVNVCENGEEEGDEDPDAELALREIELKVCTSRSPVDYSNDAEDGKDDTPPRAVEDLQAVPSQESTPRFSSPTATSRRSAPHVKHSLSILEHLSSYNSVSIRSPASSAQGDGSWNAESTRPSLPTIPRPLPNPRARPAVGIIASTSAAFKKRPQPLMKRLTEVIRLSSISTYNYPSAPQPQPQPPPSPVKIANNSRSNLKSSQDKRAPMNHKRTKSVTSTSARTSIQVRPDSNAMEKREKKQFVEEEDEEEDGVAKETSRIWREKFMLRDPSRVQLKTERVNQAELSGPTGDASLIPSSLAPRYPAGHACSAVCVSTSNFLVTSLEDSNIERNVRSPKRQKIDTDPSRGGSRHSKTPRKPILVDPSSARSITSTPPQPRRIVNGKGAHKKTGYQSAILDWVGLRVTRRYSGELSSDPIENSSSESDSETSSDEIEE
ncbi:hypothetical protein JCM5350_002154 [Sporobolomyces pararoseus]